MKICLVQCHSNQDVKLNLDYAKTTIEKTAKYSCDLVVFPRTILDWIYCNR